MILVIRRNLQVTAFTWLVDCTMDSFIEAVANLLRIHGDDFHVCSSQFQSFQSFNRFAPFITGISPFQTFQKPALSLSKGSIAALTNYESRSNRSSRSTALLRSSRGSVRSKRSRRSIAALRSRRFRLTQVLGVPKFQLFQWSRSTNQRSRIGGVTRCQRDRTR